MSNTCKQTICLRKITSIDRRKQCLHGEITYIHRKVLPLGIQNHVYVRLTVLG